MVEEEEHGKAGLGNKWRLFVELVQIVWARERSPNRWDG